MRSSLSRAAAFTVPEVLAVVAIIVIILSILMPNFGKARKTARIILCKNQQRQIGWGMMTFATEHKGAFPGVYLPPWSGPEEEKRSWMGKEVWAAVSYEGAIVRYLGGVAATLALVRCPDLEQGTWGGSNGSNGLFDMTSLLVFSGARRYAVPNNAEWIDPTSAVKRTAPTPLIVEEDYINYVNNPCCMEPGHSNIDRLGVWHEGGGNYIAVDGHSEYLKPDGKLGPTTWDWYVKTPSGAAAQLSSHASGWGGWNSR